MNRRVFVRVADQRIVLLPHAIERYAERGCRHDDLHLATDELVLLLTRHGHVTVDRPGWVHESDNARRTDMWMLLGDDIAFPLEQAKPWLLAAMTCICHAGVGIHRRASRSKRAGVSPITSHRSERRRRRDQQVPPIEDAA